MKYIAAVFFLAATICFSAVAYFVKGNTTALVLTLIAAFLNLVNTVIFFKKSINEK